MTEDACKVKLRDKAGSLPRGPPMEAVPKWSEPSEPAVPKQPPYPPPNLLRLASSAQLDTVAKRPKLQFYGKRPIEQPMSIIGSLLAGTEAPKIVPAEEPASTVRKGLRPPNQWNMQKSGIIDVETIVLNTLELNGTWSSASFPVGGAEWNYESKTLTLDMEVVPNP